MSSQPRLALVGFGLIGRRHAEAVTKSQAADIAVVVDPSPAGREAAEALGYACQSDLADALGNGGIDGVILATPNNLHFSQAMECVAQGVPVLIEKPITTRASEAAEIVRAAQAAGVPVLVGHHRRHNPLIRRAHQIIAEGAIGDVRGVQSICWFCKPDAYYAEAEWRTQPGAGPVAVNLTHDVDLLRFLCGEVASVRAVSRPSARGHAVEDIASAILEFINGALGTISVSDNIASPWSWELTSREDPAYPGTGESCYLIGGSEGSLSLPDLRLWRHEGDRRHWHKPMSATMSGLAQSEPLVNQVRNFADVIAGRAEPVVSGEEGMRSLRVIEAIQHSASTGDRVALPD